MAREIMLERSIFVFVWNHAAHFCPNNALQLSNEILLPLTENGRS
jgi:hypothetical protein